VDIGTMTQWFGVAVALIMGLALKFEHIETGLVTLQKTRKCIRSIDCSLSASRGGHPNDGRRSELVLTSQDPRGRTGNRPYGICGEVKGTDQNAQEKEVTPSAGQYVLPRNGPDLSL
jgi:hypothetical protein